MEVTTGSPEAEYRTSPQRHPPWMFGTVNPPLLAFQPAISTSSRVPTAITCRLYRIPYPAKSYRRIRISISVAPILNHPFRFRPPLDKKNHRPHLTDSTWQVPTGIQRDNFRCP